MNCWLCDKPIEPPAEIIGRWSAGISLVVHRACLQTLVDLEADFNTPDIQR